LHAATFVALNAVSKAYAFAERSPCLSLVFEDRVAPADGFANAIQIRE
jgi:hypothetical protein